MMENLHFLSALEAGSLIKTKKISPVEYAEALIHRIEKYDQSLNSFLSFMPEIALEDAKKAEREIMKGEWRGYLHGIPYGLKDNIDYEGVRTSVHSKILQDNIAVSDAEVTHKLRAGGGVFMGKLATHEFATGGPSFDLPWPPARNPWNRDYFCGGSSSGSAVATAAGFLPLALGTDTGGSIRSPASLCGVVGMKATYDLVSRSGVFPLAYSLDHVGPLTRTVHDNAMALELISGAADGTYTSQLGEELKGTRVGVIRHFHTQDLDCDPEISSGIENALHLLDSLGAAIEDVETAPLGEFATLNRIILSAEAYAIHENWLRDRPQDYASNTRERIMPGAFISAASYINSTRFRLKMARLLDSLFERVDVLVTVNTAVMAHLIDDEEARDRNHGQNAWSPFNLTGNPALSIPIGLSKAGLPLGMQIVGRHHAEAQVYKVAHAFEQASEWSKQHPTLSDFVLPK